MKAQRNHVSFSKYNPFHGGPQSLRLEGHLQTGLLSPASQLHLPSTLAPSPADELWFSTFGLLIWFSLYAEALGWGWITGTVLTPSQHDSFIMGSGSTALKYPPFQAIF